MIGTKPWRKRFWSIRTKFIVSFCLLFLGIMTAIGLMEMKGLPFTDDIGWEGELKAEAFRSLDLVADLKKERLLRWIGERRGNLNVTAWNDLTFSAVVGLQKRIVELADKSGEDTDLWNSVRREKVYSTLLNQLENIKTTYEVYDRILIVDPQTVKIIVSTDDSDLGSDPAHGFHFKRALQVNGSYIDDVETCSHKEIPVLYFNRAIRNNDEDRAVAVLVMVVDAENMIRPMLHAGEGLGKKGEALLVNRKVRILTSLKHPLADGTTAEPLEYQLTDEPAIRAARGYEGIIEAEDYRGEPVLAAFRHIRITPDWGWGMVVKRDQSEIFAPLRQHMISRLWIGLIGIGGFVLLTVILSGNLTRPIQSLSRMAAKVAGGDLDARVPITTSDEVGILAESFNDMIQKIKERTEALKGIQEELVRKEKLAMMGQLSGGVGHELRNPLGVISNAVYYLKMVLPDAGENIKEYLEIISAEVGKSEKIVSDLLNFSRTKTLTREEITVSQLVDQVLEKRIPGKGIEVTTDIAKDQPSLYVDFRQMEQVFSNLVTNACQAMPGGGTLAIKSEVCKEKVRISVCDTGCGIPDEILKKIFEPLFTTKARGIGLGLSVARKYVNDNGGSFEVESKKGKGSIFTINLPVKATQS